MDDPQVPAQGIGLSRPGAETTFEPPDDPADLAPLRLVLQPTGMAIDLTRREVLLGRHSEADVRLALPDVSRRHCRFVFSNSRWQVIDLDSLNGTFVNDRRIRKATLNHGDRLRVGGFTFTIDLPLAAAPTVPLPSVRPDGKIANAVRSIAEFLAPPKQETLPEKRKAS